jgi:predicted RNase H-like nuclease
MTWLAGADGCRTGWFRVCRRVDTAELRFAVLKDVRELLEAEPVPKVLAIDIPIGLPSAGARECDRAARKVLGPRRNSVFPAPVRAAIRARSREEASRITQAIDGRKLSVQAWAICPKIREVDDLLLGSQGSRGKVWEVHPEVSFWAWNGEEPMVAAKKKKAGRQERLRLAEEWLGAGILKIARDNQIKENLADDDILDAIAVLWTAERIAQSQAGVLPREPELDEHGLPMRIVY